MVPALRGRKGGLDASLRAELLALEIGGVALDEPVGPYTAFSSGGPADAVALVSDLDDWGRLLAWCRGRKVAVTQLGWGCGVVVRDPGIVGVVVSTRALDRLEPVAAAGEGDARVRVRAEAGAPVKELVRWAAAAGVEPQEGLADADGTVGGLLCRFWPALRRYVVTVGLLGDRGRVRVRDAAELGERLPLPGRTALAWATFAFPVAKGATLFEDGRFTTNGAVTAEPAVRGKMRLFRDLKDGRKPGEVLAGLGLCGIRLRGVTIDDRDPNRAINRGEGSSEDLQQLAQYVKRRASESAGVDLEEAYRLIGKK
jgi:UDP-N-acetylmuramate dehydrogenase